MKLLPLHVLAKEAEAGQFRLIGPMVISIGGGGGAVGFAHAPATAMTASKLLILERLIGIPVTRLPEDSRETLVYR